MTDRLDRAALLDRLAALETDRAIIAIAGAPGAGKSTLAAWLCAALNKRAPGSAAILGMDAYHLDDRVLDARGLRPRKGAPETFDVGGLAAMLKRLARNDEAEVLAPAFDRSIEIARAGAVVIPQSVRLILVEGNYLLLDEPPWTALAPYFDLSIWIDVEETALRDRLTRRWVDIGLDDADVQWKLDGNDLPNGRRARLGSRQSDFVVTTED